MLCNEAQRVQAYFDGELDAGASVVIEQHLAHCAGCAALMADLQSTRDAIRGEVSYFGAGGQIRSQISRLLDQETGKSWAVRDIPAGGKTFWWGVASGIVPTAIAAAL